MLALKKTFDGSKVKLVGEGVYGRVYLVQMPNNKRIAVKVGKTAINEKRKHTDLYSIMKATCQTMIIKPIDIHPDVYAMEYIDGVNLKEILVSNKVSFANKTKILSKVKNAFKCLWKSGYIHGDAHLENIMVIKTNNDFKIKLIDFGFLTKVKALVGNDYHAWFAEQWKKLNVSLGNPNLIYFNTNMPFYATKHKRIIKQFVSVK
jgi:serine/threonine protein kinase